VKSGEKTFNGVTNIGVRPTVDNDGKLSIETHIFDFNNEIYDTTITIEFIARLRDEKKFGSIDELKNQIALDIQKAKELL
jgi:riboflavin kinase/FMN adenylyltransferase